MELSLLFVLSNKFIKLFVFFIFILNNTGLCSNILLSQNKFEDSKTTKKSNNPSRLIFPGTESYQQGEVYRFDRLDILRPTQSALGVVAAATKQKKMEAMSPKGLQTYLAVRPIPIIIGPYKELFLIDRHHLLRALDSMWYRGEVRMFIQEDLSPLEYDEFVVTMIKKGYTYLMNESFQPIEFKDLPISIKDLKDNEWRSIAGALRREEAYDKPLADPEGKYIPRPFLEFLLAQQLWLRFENHKELFIAYGIDPDQLIYKEKMAFSRLMVRDPDIHDLLYDINFRWFAMNKRLRRLKQNAVGCARLRDRIVKRLLIPMAPSFKPSFQVY